MYIVSVNSLPAATIVNAIYSTGVSFMKINLTTSNACMCSCINQPHCLSLSVMKTSDNTYYCQLFATYPAQNSQLSSSLTSNVTIYTDRTLSSVYINNGTHLSNPTSLFSSTINLLTGTTSLFSSTTSPWIPAFKLFGGNNQSFLWFNSSNLTTLTPIPGISVNQTASHWFNVLISQWNQNLYTPNQIAIAFIVNRTVILDFLIFNVTQPNITSWFSLTHLISNQFWSISQYAGTTYDQTFVKAVYTDNVCIRSFNCNFKSTTSCSSDFLGVFFVYGGYTDLCIAAARNISQVPIPSIFYSPSINPNGGNLSGYYVADGLMGFVR